MRQAAELSAPINLRLEAEQRLKIEAMAAKESRSFGAMVRELLREALKRKKV